MPELPEVEIMARQLRRRLVGRQVRRVEVTDRKLRVDGALLVGQQIEGVRRRGKFLVLDFTGDRHLLVHLRMSGWFEFSRPARYRLALDLDGAAVYFEDPRRFGVAEVLSNGALERRLARLGPEPFDGALDRLQRTRRPVKVALLDQTLVAGVGNIYANEALWRARIDPRRAAARLSSRQLDHLRRALVTVMRRAIALGPAIFARQTFAVYERAGQPCRRCDATIRRILLGQRGTYFCPRCQR